MNSFSLQTKVYFGDNALSHLEELQYKKALIIADPFVKVSGMISLITQPLEKGNIEYKIFSDVVPDAPIDKISLGVSELLSYKPDVLIAVGGGSAIDSAKAIKEFAIKINSYNKIPLIAIPTTSGTGSEVTSISVVSNPETKTKQPISSVDMIPNEAILDVELVKSVPPAITADTGMDVFTHALEACVCKNNNEFSEALAEKAIEICGVFLLRSYLNNEDIHARKKMHCASCLAGISFNSSSLGLNHGMAHQLGAFFHIPHGRANALLLPHIIEFNSDITKNSKSRKEYETSVVKYSMVAKILGLSSYNEIMSVRSLVNWVQFMIKEMDMPISISQIGTIKEEDYMSKIDSMADAALTDACTVGNPRTPTKEEIIQLYKNLW